MSILSDIEAKAHSILIGVDDTVSAALFDTGSDVTISARCGMAVLDQLVGKPATAEGETLRGIAAVLDSLQPGHCFGAVLGDLVRAASITHTLTPYGEYIKAHGLHAAYP